MTRMSREFSLVLLGSGILSAGYFLAPSPEEELEKKADLAAAERVGGADRNAQGHYHYRPGFIMIWAHSPGYSGGASRAPAVSGVSRGGFGTVGRSVGAGS